LHTDYLGSFSGAAGCSGASFCWGGSACLGTGAEVAALGVFTAGGGEFLRADFIINSPRKPKGL